MEMQASENKQLLAAENKMRPGPRDADNPVKRKMPRPEPAKTQKTVIFETK